MLNHKTLLITGGSGSFGRNFIAHILSTFPQVKEIRIFSRDELKHYEMQHYFDWGKHPSLRYILGDIRDFNLLADAMEGVDYVIHAAALKHVQMGENNHMAFIQTNIIGSENVIRCARQHKVKRVVALSTDKAAAAVSLYGATKLCADKLFTHQHNNNTIFSVVRYGNVMGTSGSVIPHFKHYTKKGFIPLTHPDMTRFNVTPQQSIDFILYALVYAQGGEIFVPKLSSFKVIDLASAIAPDVPTQIIGLRAGEKLHEEMITITDAPYTIENDHYYVIVPFYKDLTHYITHYKAKSVASDFYYSSDKNDSWLDLEDLRALLF